jgi:hypothetical protein
MIPEDMVNMKMGVDQGHGPEPLFVDVARKFLLFLDVLTTRVNDYAVAILI